MLLRLVIITVFSLLLPKTVVPQHRCENISNIIGHAAVSFDSHTVLPLFTTLDASAEPVQILRFYDDRSTNGISFRAEGAERYDLLRPESHKLDYSIFDLPVRGRRVGWLEVVVDRRLIRTLWLREVRPVRFRDWQSTMREAFAVERVGIKGGYLHAAPSVKARAIRFAGRGCFGVKRMRGAWIEVMQQDVCDERKGAAVRGWMKWRDERGCLLIEIYPFA